MDEWFDQRNAVLVKRLDNDTRLLLLKLPERVCTQVAELEQEALPRINKESLFDDLAEVQPARRAAQDALGFLHILHHVPVFIGDENAERTAGQLPEVVVDNMRHERKRGEVWIDDDARAKGFFEPVQISLFGDGTMDDFELVACAHIHQGREEIEARLNGKSTEEVAGIDDFVGVDFEIVRAIWEKASHHSGEFGFDGEPFGFRHKQGSEDENRLLCVVEIAPGISGFIEIDEVHRD